MIIWGTKKVYRHLGYVADYCPICVGARGFSLERVGMAGHLYYITAGDGKLVGYQLNCLDCDVLLNGEPERYTAFAKKPADVPTLIKETFPNFAVFHKNRLLLENQVRTSLASLPADVRASLIMEPFLLLSPKVVERFASTHFEMGRTYMRREIIPVLASTLARLRPTEDELQAALNRLIQMRDPMGKNVRLDDLMEALNARYAQSPGDSTVFGTSEFSTPGDGGSKRVRPAGKRSGGALLPYEKAGKAIKIIGWITAFSLFMLVMTSISSTKPIGVELFAVSAALATAIAAMFYASTQIMRHTKNGRILGIVLGVLCLPLFPIGTGVGAYILWHLTKGWGEDEDETAPEYAT